MFKKKKRNIYVYKRYIRYGQPSNWWPKKIIIPSIKMQLIKGERRVEERERKM